MLSRCSLILLCIAVLVSTSCQKPQHSISKSYIKQQPLPLPLDKAPDESLLAGPYEPMPSNELFIHNARIHTAVAPAIEKGYLRVKNGRITQLGQGEVPHPDPKQVRIIDAGGRSLTPGIIDVHSHMGVYAIPKAKALADGNEATSPNRADVWAEHSFWPQDPSLWRALAAGVTTIQVLPGSANLFGGRTFVARLKLNHFHPQKDQGHHTERSLVSAKSMAFPGAPQGLKMACGENPKRVYGKKSGPSTRMGNAAGYRKALDKAKEYQRRWQLYHRDLAHYESQLEELQSEPEALRSLGDPPKVPNRNRISETLVQVLEGKILVHAHCYRGDEMIQLLELAREYGFKIHTFHHASEAYKIAPELAAAEVAIATWADWWGFKMEAYDGIAYNAALSHAAGVRTIIHSDSAEDIRFLNQEAAKAARYGRQLGLDIPDYKALQWFTVNAAWALGLSKEIGSLEVGKRADMVLWSADPLSHAAVAQQVFMDGELVYHRQQQQVRLSDFELGDAAQQRQAFPTAAEGPLPSLDLKKIAEGPRLTLAPLPQESGALWLQNVRIHKGDGTEGFMGQVLVRGDEIIAVGKELLPAEHLPPEVLEQGLLEEIDGGGGSLTPGLIELASDNGLVEVSMEKDTDDSYVKDQLFNPSLKAISGFNHFSSRIPLSRAEGITTTLVRPSGGLLAGQGLLTSTASGFGAVLHPQAVQVGRLAGGSTGRPSQWQGLDNLVGETAMFLGKSVKIDDEKLPERYRFQHGVADWLAMAQVLQGQQLLMMTVHRASDIWALLGWQQRLEQVGFDLKLVLVGATESWLLADRLAQQQVAVVVTPSQQTPTSFDKLQSRQDLAAYLMHKGVTVALSTQGRYERRLRQQMGHAVRYGVVAERALAAVTSVPARILGLRQRGLIRAGMKADLVLWSGPPWRLDSQVKRLWLAGTPQSLANRHLHLAERYLREIKK